MEIPRHWRLKAQRYQMEGSACPNCGQPIFPPRPVCSYCHSQPKLIAAWELQAFPEMKRVGTDKLEVDHGGRNEHSCQ